MSIAPIDPEGPSDPAGGIFGVNADPDHAAVILIPVPFDATTSYGRAAADGPQAILEASDQLDLYDRTLGRPYEHGIALVTESKAVRAWNDEARLLADKIRAEPTHADKHAWLEQVNAIGSRLNHWLEIEARGWLDDGRIVGVIGGDHSTPFGAIRAHLQRYPNMGILHVDAHADMRVAYEGFTWSHASIMHNILERTPLKTLVQVGIRDFSQGECDAIKRQPNRVSTFFDDDLVAEKFNGTPFNQMIERILAPLPEEVYVSFDIDGLDPSFCPHTGTPVPGGLSFHEACALIAGITKSGRRIVGFDLNEVAPGGPGDEWDGNVGARLLYKLCGHALLHKATELKNTVKR